MGLETELQFRKGRGEGFSPNTVLPSPRHCSDLEKGNVKAKGINKSARKDNRLSLKEDFREISFGRYRSSSCKNVQSRPFVGFESNVEMKRGSVYQSSREVSKMKNRGSVDERRKIEAPQGSDDGFLSLRAVGSLRSFGEERNRERSSVMSQNADDFFEICLDSNNQETRSSENGGGVSTLPQIDGNEIVEKATTLHKSLSGNVGMSKLPSSSEKFSKTRFNPIRKIFDPFVKSKSVHSPLSDTMEVSKANDKMNKTLPKSLLDDFSKAPDLDRQHSLVTDSPVHLHGRLKLENNDGMPYFEFSLKFPEDVLVAKTWKADNASDWVYTFHSIDNRKRSNVNSCNSNDSNKEMSMVGQMRVSCYLCSDLRDERGLDSSMVTEFVLYDITHARKSVVAAQDCSKIDRASDKGFLRRLALGKEPDLAKVNPQPRHVLGNKELDSSRSGPWEASELHPSLEIAATVIQVPFEKRESLKCKRGDTVSDKMQSNLLKLLKIDSNGRVTDSSSSTKVNVVIPSGNHGMPSEESRGPSPLLDRWRLGGGCDCGGWDMACPLFVFGNPDLQSGEDQNQRPLKLFSQGSRENTPALTLTLIKEGEYAVDFHAQLSTLQAFSMCVSILHSSEASTSAAQERNNQLPQHSSLKTLIEEKTKFLIEAVTEDEKRKVTKTRKQTLPSFVLNPPFSPIARV